MKKCMTAMKRALSLALVLTLLVAGMPVNAFAAAAQELRAPVSAPLEQPASIDYETMLGLEDDADGGNEPADVPPGPDSAAASDAESSSEISDASGAPTKPDAPAEDKTPDISSAPESTEPETPDASSVPESTEPEQPDSSSDPAASLPAEDSAESDSSVSEKDSGSAAPSEEEAPEDGNEEKSEETPGDETSAEPAEPAELRLPFVREKYDPYAAQYGDPVEVTEYTRVYARRSRARSANSRQEFIAVISPVPNTYTDENGQEQPIDNTLIVTEDGGVPTYENAANDLQIELPAAFAPGDGLTVTLGEHFARLVPLAGDFTRPASLENAVRYNDVFPGVDVQYTAQEWMVKEDVILNEPSAYSAFTYRLETSLEPRVVDGMLYLFRAGSERPVFHFAPPLMMDAAGAVSYDVSMQYAETDGQWTVSICADESWLNAPERVYPVVIDPSLVNTEKAAASLLSPAQSYYYSTAGTSVAGYAWKKWAGYPDDTTTLQIHRAIFNFPGIFDNLPAPEDVEIESAELILYEYEDLSGGQTTFELYQLKTPCTLDALDAHPGYSWFWDYVTGLEREYAGTFQSSVGYHKIDVTDVVNNWMTGAAPNYGFMLMAYPEVYQSTESLGALFYNNGLSPDVPPCIEIKWYEVGDVDRNYSLDDTTIELRPVTASWKPTAFSGTALPRRARRSPIS